MLLLLCFSTCLVHARIEGGDSETLAEFYPEDITIPISVCDAQGQQLCAASATLLLCAGGQPVHSETTLTGRSSSAGGWQAVDLGDPSLSDFMMLAAGVLKAPPHVSPPPVRGKGRVEHR